MATEEIGVQFSQFNFFRMYEYVPGTWYVYMRRQRNVLFHDAHSINFDAPGVGGTGKAGRTVEQYLTSLVSSHQEFGAGALVGWPTLNNLRPGDMFEKKESGDSLFDLVFIFQIIVWCVMCGSLCVVRVGAVWIPCRVGM